MQDRCENCFSVNDSGDLICLYCGHEKGAKAEEKVYLDPGTELNGRYIVGQVIGSGGFGFIYKGWDKNNSRIVAIKEFYQSGLVTRAPDSDRILLVAASRASEFEEGKQRFYDEAINTGKFIGDHNIVAVLDIFEGNSTVYYVMEYLRGHTFSSYITDKKLKIDESIDVVLRVADALKAVHAEGIIHRDVSPDNIFIPPDYPTGDVKLFDFGAARFKSDEKETMQTRIMKPGYSPPEQYGPGIDQNEQTDIYALGATLYHALTGYVPEEATNRRIEDKLPEPVHLNMEIPPHVNDAILAAMALDPHLRLKTAEEFQLALRGQIKSVSPDILKAKIKKRRRTVKLSAAAVIAAGVIAIGAQFMIAYGNSTLPPSDIFMIYSVSGDTAADGAKQSALESIVDEFMATYPKVTVTLTGVEQSGYSETVDGFLQRGSRPGIVESAEIEPDTLSKTLDLGGVLDNVLISDCYFLDNYKAYFPNRRQIPVGIIAPVIYINRQINPYEKSGVGNMSALLASMPFTVSEMGISCNNLYINDFIELFGDNYLLAERDGFINDQTGAYFSDTAEYNVILNEMPGRFKILYIDATPLPATFSGMWSVMPGNPAEQRAATRLLRAMLGENAQNYLHILNKSGALPINRQAIGTYAEVYSDFSDFFTNFGDYTFSQY